MSSQTEWDEFAVLVWLQRELKEPCASDRHKRAEAIMRLVWRGEHRFPDQTYRHQYAMAAADAQSWRERLDFAVETLRLIKESGALKEHAFDRGDDDASISEMLNAVLASAMRCGR